MRLFKPMTSEQLARNDRVLSAVLDPKRMPPERYLHWLKILLLFAPAQIILATYAWTIVNLGTSSLTTDYHPLVFREDGWVWRYYLGAVIIAGAAFVPVAVQKVIRLVSQSPLKQD